jgi:hypothetical protein
VVKNRNSANKDIFYGKAGDLTGDDREHVEVLPALALRGLSTLFWSHLNPYGRLELDMSNHLNLAPDRQPDPGGA